MGIRLGIAAVAAVVLMTGTAQAQETLHVDPSLPPGMVEVVPAPAAPAPAPSVGQASARRRLWRHGFVFSFGASCINVRAASDTCFAVARLGYELKFAELHVGFIGAQGNGVHERPFYYTLVASEPRSLAVDDSTRLGVQAGADFGTPYFRLKGWGRGGALRLAGRASVDVDVIFMHQVGGTNNHVVLTNTYGPNLAVDVVRHFGIYARVGIGWAMVDRAAETFTLDAFGGLHALF